MKHYNEGSKMCMLILCFPCEGKTQNKKGVLFFGAKTWDRKKVSDKRNGCSQQKQKYFYYILFKKIKIKKRELFSKKANPMS